MSKIVTPKWLLPCLLSVLYIILSNYSSGQFDTGSTLQINPNQFEGNDTQRIRAAIEAATGNTNKIVIPPGNANGTNIPNISRGDVTLPAHGGTKKGYYDPQEGFVALEDFNKYISLETAFKDSFKHISLGLGFKDLVFDEVVEGTETFKQQVRLMRAEAAGKVSVSGSTVSFRDAADSKDRIVATVDDQGQRTSITTDAN